jgi:hypothetical protein
VIVKFLENFEDPQCEPIVKTLLEKLQDLGCNTSLKLHFLHSYLHYLLENLGTLRREKGERLDQDIKRMERRHQGRWDISVMVDYCWCLTRDGITLSRIKKAKKLSVHMQRSGGGNRAITFLKCVTIFLELTQFI